MLVYQLTRPISLDIPSEELRVEVYEDDLSNHRIQYYKGNDMLNEEHYIKQSLGNLKSIAQAWIRNYRMIV